MNAGRLRHRVSIQAAVETQDGFGEPVKTWEAVATRWASIEPLQGKEFFEAQQVAASVSHRVTMRHYTGLTTKHRLLHGSDVYNIEAVINPNKRDKTTQVLCTEEV